MTLTTPDEPRLTGRDADASIADLVKRVSDDAQRLAKAEIALAREEMSGKARAAGTGAGLLGAAGVVVWFAVAVLITAGVLGLAVVWPAWLAALAVGVALVLIAGLLALGGRASLRRVPPLVPPTLMASLRADLAAVRRGMAR